MFYGRHLSSLSETEQLELETIIEELTRPEAVYSLREYHDTSIRSSILSRQEMRMDELSDEERFIMRMYGRFGLVINNGVRKNPNMPVDIASSRDVIKRYYNPHNNGWDFEGISSLDGDDTQDNLYHENGFLSRALRQRLNQMIDDHELATQGRRAEKLYRIAVVRKGIFNTLDEIVQMPHEIHTNDLISPGDVLVDEALWSTSSSSGAALKRYSRFYGSATDSRPRRTLPTYPIDTDAEEVIFVIKNRPHLKSLDISGFKMNKEEGKSYLRAGRRGPIIGIKAGKDRVSSSEMLIKSGTRFRVLSIQTTQSMQPRRADWRRENHVGERRVVILEPLQDNEAVVSSHFPTAALRNCFDGRILWEGHPTVAARPDRTSMSRVTPSVPRVNALSLRYASRTLGGEEGTASGLSFDEGELPLRSSPLFQTSNRVRSLAQNFETGAFGGMEEGFGVLSLEEESHLGAVGGAPRATPSLFSSPPLTSRRLSSPFEGGITDITRPELPE